MKKIIYTIGAMMFMSAVLHPWLGMAEDSTSTTPQDQSCSVLSDPNCLVSQRLAYALRGKGNEGLDWGDSFGSTDPKKIGQNLYIDLYNKSQSKPANQAIKDTAAAYGMPVETMSMILAGNISPILERAPLMSIEQATRIYNQMIDTYNSKKDSADLDATIKTKVEANEMFADGDLGNSGFDLINDLNNIEIILFQKNDQVSFGQPYDGSKGGDADKSKSATSAATSTGPIGVDISGGAGAATGTSTGSTNGSTDTNPKMQNPFQLDDDNKSSVAALGINPNQCFSAQNIDKALNDFAATGKVDDRLKSNFDADQLPGGVKTPTGLASNSGPSGAGLDIPLPVAASDLLDKTEIPAAAAGDYSQPSLCGDIVCLTIDLVKKKATPIFNKVDNCIACHVEYINDSLQKTISHSLIPAKASGNLGESGLCKNAAGTALGLIGMNMSIQLVPMVAAPKDDLMKEGNISDEWNKYASKYGGWNYDTQP